ncbi:unnamed protein product [Leuciscus chuanchicus]
MNKYMLLVFIMVSDMMLLREEGLRVHRSDMISSCLKETEDETIQSDSSHKCRSEDTVDQPDKHVTEAEGRSVTLQCKYKTDSAQENVFWYIQRANDFPKYILRRSKYGGENGTEFQERFHSELSSNSVPLMIQDMGLAEDFLDQRRGFSLEFV